MERWRSEGIGPRVRYRQVDIDTDGESCLQIPTTQIPVRHIFLAGFRGDPREYMRTDAIGQETTPTGNGWGFVIGDGRLTAC